MTNIEKLEIMDKIIRELEDICNSSTALLKKVAQAETENINLGNKLLEERLPIVFEHIDGIVNESTSLNMEFSAVRETFYKENKLDEVLLPS